MLDKDPCVGAVFLDLNKAYDTVNHQVLLTKLTYFSADALSWIESYRTRCVTVVGVKSPYLSSNVGVLQGSILGPLIFSLYIDLPNVCPELNVQMYADDTVMDDAKSIAANLTNALTKLQDWLRNNSLRLTLKKQFDVHQKKQKTATHNIEKPDPPTKRPMKQSRSFVFLKAEELKLVTQFKVPGGYVRLQPHI